jgi:hypothetical protein
MSIGAYPLDRPRRPMRRLQADLDPGIWRHLSGHWLTPPELDLGHREVADARLR